MNQNTVNKETAAQYKARMDGHDFALEHFTEHVTLTDKALAELARTSCREAMDNWNKSCDKSKKLDTQDKKMAWGKEYSPTFVRCYRKYTEVLQRRAEEAI